MATSSERSPPPFPDSEDQDVLDTEEVGQRDSDGDDDGDELFMSTLSDPAETEATPPLTSQNTDPSIESPTDLTNDPLIDPISDTSENKPVVDVLSEPSDDFEDLSNNDSGSADDEPVSAESKNDTMDDFFDILGSDTEAAREEVAAAEVIVAAAGGKSDIKVADTPSQGKKGSENEQEKEKKVAPIVDITGDLLANNTQPATKKIADPLVDFLNDAPPVEVKKTNPPVKDLFEEEGSDLFAEPLQTKPAKPQKGLFGEEDEDLFCEPLGATAKKPTTTSSSNESKPVTMKADTKISSKGAIQRDLDDIFTEEAVASVPVINKPSSATSKTNGLHEETDIFADATVELSLDSPRNERKRDVAAKPSASASSLSAPASLAKPLPSALEELEEEEAEEDDKFEIEVRVTNPEKIGDGMNAYMAYKVSTQTTLAMFRSPTFTVRRRYSDFLGLYEKLSEKHGPNGYIVPPPPEKSILGMTKVKVGKDDSSSADFLERRRGALERYVQRVVSHPMLLQDPDVREFLEREELPRAVSTQALSGAGFLKMINKATDAVSKMTIKMNESDVWFEDKLQEVEAADQHFRKLHALVESLVVHRKELSLNTASFAKSAAMLGSAEDNTALSRALSQLSEVEDKMEQLHQEQAASDTFIFAEHIADFIRLLGAVRGSFDHRMKAWQRWQDAQTMLQKKREAEAKLLWANKPDKLQLAKEEIAEWETKVTQYEREFERVSATVRKEVQHFERERAKNFKKQIMKYLESMLQSQQQLIKYWEAFLPEAKAIA